MSNAAECLAQYDAIEVHGCRYVFGYYDACGVPTEVEQVDDEQAKFWGVYGHRPREGLEHLCDCPTRATAEVIAEVLEKVIEIRVALEA